METEWERRSQLGLPKLAEFIYYFSGSGTLTCQCAVYHSYTPYVTDYFLLENPKSNSQVTKSYLKVLSINKDMFLAF